MIHEEGWLAQRDPDGTIQRDLDESGGLGDGLIDHVDGGLLLFTRPQRAGIDATFDTSQGQHNSADKLPKLVAYLVDVA